MNLERDLNPRQRQAVTFGDSPLLVLAGPGTGKTRVITYRVAHLVQVDRARPDHVLTLTFTNKAAQELSDRVHSLLGSSIAGEVCVGTFHTICSRLLRECAPTLGLRTDFAIFDQESQDAILAEVLRQVGVDSSPWTVARVRDLISLEKTALRDPAQAVFEVWDDEGTPIESPHTREQLRIAVAAYVERLRSHSAFDFDDLLAVTTEGLRMHESIRDRYRDRFRYVLVDEYQDINCAQYEFLRALVGPPHRITAVGDEDQSIYRWRGSSPEWLRRFREDFQPKVVELEQNYRSTKMILDVAGKVIANNRRGGVSQLVTDSDVGDLPYAYRFADEEAAASGVAKLVRRLHREAHVAYRDIAVFYRRHSNADLLSDRLTKEGIPHQRILPASHVFDGEEAGVVSWLRYLTFGLDANLLDALRFPTDVLDEWSRVWLQARANRMSLRLAESIERENGDIPPLTRVSLIRALRRLDGLGTRIDGSSAADAVRALLEELDLHRSPFDLASEEPEVGGDLIALDDAADVLHAAVAREEPIHIHVAGSLDEVCAGLVLQSVLKDYFGCTASLDIGETVALAEGVTLVVGPIDVPSAPNRRVIWIGAPETAWALHLCPRRVDGGPHVAAWVALRLCQRLLAAAEKTPEEGVVVYDLETTGNSLTASEIIEFAATRLGKPETTDHRYIKPRRSIPRFLTQIHGIGDSDVENEPSIEEQVGPIRDFLGDAILVGHNVESFDNRLLAREFDKHLKVPLHNATYDTYTVAKRLYPHENHKLESLARKFGLEHGTLHRALQDAEVTKALFRALRTEELDRRARTSLPEYLPFVAVGMLARGAWESEALSRWRQAAVRWLTTHDMRREVAARLPKELRGEARRMLDTVMRSRASETAADSRWHALRERLLRRVTQFEETSESHSLRDFLNARALAQPTDELDSSKDAVTLMTLHSAKGTEYRAVIVTTLEEGILPGFRAPKDPELMAEERRLFYVGMTRAKERLYLVSARNRDGRDREPSRFLSEIPANLLRTWSANGA